MKWLLWAVAGLAAALAGYLLIGWFLTCYVSFPRDPAARDQARAFLKELSSTTTSADVDAALSSGRFPKLRHRIALPHDGTGDLALQTPAECDVKNWVVWLRFEDHQLLSATVGTLDSRTEQPTDAPGPLEFSPAVGIPDLPEPAGEQGDEPVEGL